MARKIFISYRRRGDLEIATAIAQSLKRRFGNENVFFDLEMRPGVKFAQVLEERLEQSAVLLALLGPGWLGPPGQDGRRRIDDADDWMRREISLALQRKIPVIPVRIKGAELPASSDLPDDIKRLLDHHAAIIGTETFAGDAEQLADHIEAMHAGGLPWKRLAAAAIILAALGGGLFAYRSGALTPAHRVGEVFRDCPDVCPEMTAVPAGSFAMGSPADEPERVAEREGRVAVTIAKPFAVGRLAVTRGEFAQFARATDRKTEGGCYAWHPDPLKQGGGEWIADPKRSWQSPGFEQDDRHPVTCVSWHDAKAYVAWLATRTGKPYRLLSEGEREYVARAGTVTPFWWGATISTRQANYNGSYAYAGGERGEFRFRTVAADSFAPNPWGLYNVHGNVWDWTEDCWSEGNAGNPGDGSTRVNGDCTYRAVRGGSWVYRPSDVRAAVRLASRPFDRFYNLGLRVARSP